jgi:acetyl esterase/lipase
MVHSPTKNSSCAESSILRAFWQQCGVDITLRIWDDMWHAWPVLGELIPESRMAFEELAEFLHGREAFKDGKVLAEKGFGRSVREQ